MHLINPCQTWSKNYKSCLILRKPIDIVISRTFRKSEYRDSIHPGISDDEYLEKNINGVIKFFRSALAFNHSAIICFEDLFSYPEKCGTILEGLMQSAGNVEKFCQITSQVITNSSTNKYKGPTVEIPGKYIDLIKDKTGKLANNIGYKC